MSDHETIAVYDSRAQDYADRFNPQKEDRNLTAFIKRLPAGAPVLDLGCGPGNAAARLADAGFAVEAWDAAPGMIALAARHKGVAARQARFDDLDATGVYGGIWANFSLLHAPRKAFAHHITAISKALRPGGVFHIGMKTGADADRDGLGRAYTYYSIAELRAALSQAGLAVLSRQTGQDKGFAGTVDPWVILLAEKPDA